MHRCRDPLHCLLTPAVLENITRGARVLARGSAPRSSATGPQHERR
jgi:hypothetical protein